MGGDPYLPESERRSPPTVPSPGSTRPPSPPPPEDAARQQRPRSSSAGRAYLVFDLSLRKQFAVAGDVKLQIQADLFNALNRDNFRNPNTDLNAAAFGTITTVAPPRQIQLGARLTF